MASIRFDPTLRLNGLLTLRSLRPTRTAAGFAVPRRARLLILDDRAYFRLRNGALVDDAGFSVDMPTAFRLAETEAVLRAEAAAAGRSRLRGRSRIAAWAAREFWIGVLLASLAGYAALGAYLLIVLPGRLLGVW
jgi:hypothetical protein